MMPCVYCLNQTYDQCLECGDPLCFGHGMKLCPMCLRIKQFKAEQSARRRVVYWQYADDAATSLFLSIGSPIDPGASTEPIPKVEVW